MKFKHDELCDIPFENNTIIHVSIPLTTFKIDNSFAEKLNKTNIKNMNILFKNCFIKNILVTKSKLKKISN